MASLLESRWAATPEPPAGAPQAPQSTEKTEKPQDDVFASRWADTPEPEGDEGPKDTGKSEKSASGVFAARRADTPEPKPKSAEAIDDAPKSEKRTSGAFASRWAATPEPEDEVDKGIQSGANVEDKSYQSLKEKPVGEDKEDAQAQDQPSGKAETQVMALEPSEANGQQSAASTAMEEKAERSDNAPPAPTNTSVHLVPPRLKKRVSWNGRNIVISIPRFDYAAAGILKPLSKEEIEDRLKHFEQAGYDVRGYDLQQDDVAMADGPAQVRAIFPDEADSHATASNEKAKVLLPDLEKWKAYEDWLTEQKLAALGVTLGGDEPAPAPSQDMSRQSSAQQYPALPFSPPIPTSSTSSMSRPSMVRGHSHTMSVASPASPLNGPFGHMHRHSTFTGPIGLPQSQPPQQSPGIPGFQAFSPQQQYALSGLPRGGSPAQMSALRQDLGTVRGPGSPLAQQVFPQSPQDYSRGLIEDQRRRQHAYSQSMHQPMMQNTFMSQGPNVRPTPALPELPEYEDEELEEDQEPAPESAPEPAPEPPVYVPPQKRFQANTEIAVPTPRGHRHNISEGLERDVLEAEQRQKRASRDWIEVTEEEEDRAPFASSQKPDGVQRLPPPLSSAAEKDSLGDAHPAQETMHRRKESSSRFNVAAPSFTFNPNANFQPSVPSQPSSSVAPPQSSFTFGAQAARPNGENASNHNRHRSSGSFNVAAPAFKPVSSEFSFSSSGPAFGPDAAPQPPKQDRRTIIDELPSIFGKVEIPEVVKPARRSKAIPIVRPEEGKTDDSGSEHFEDDEGRVAQGEAKRKQQRRIGDDGDSVPMFAEPTPEPDLPPPEKILGSNDVRPMSAVDEIEAEVEEGLQDLAEKAEDTVVDQLDKAHHERQQRAQSQSKQNGHNNSASLSAVAKPFEPPFSATSSTFAERQHEQVNSVSDLEEGEIPEDDSRSVSPIRASEHVPNISMHDSGLASSYNRPLGPSGIPSSERIDYVAQPEPSFDEIDAVMRHLNAEDSEREKERKPSPPQLPSPGAHPMKGVTYLREQPRSDAPSPSPVQTQQDETDGDQTLNGWPQVRQLNRAEDAPTSDWSGILSPQDEEKLQQRSHFFDSHIDKLIGRIVEQRLQPLEDSLRSIQSTVNKRARSSARSSDLRLQRSVSNVDSDADDEDEMSDELKQRPISRGRDKKADQIKLAVSDALREQGPQQLQPNLDLTELHAVLADMKVSFARAASASLELDDIRAVVEDSLSRQSQALVPIAMDEGTAAHKRELSELEGRLNETLAGALEEANQRRAFEARETEARRDLRLAEEELSLLRDTARDESSRLRVMENEHEDLLNRCRREEEARRDAEARLDAEEAEKEALQATLEEYRRSSNKWRQDLDEGKRAREELENTLSSVERRNEEYQESTASMKRRLERLHVDMSTAAGQLASEKAMWKSKEADYRARIESLEDQQSAFHRERMQLEDELRIVRNNAMEAAEARHSVEHLREANNSLDEMVRRLQGDLTEQQALAARYERQFYDAQETGRAEVHRTRMSLETEMEAANHQVNLVRAELESELAKTRSELDNLRMEAETARARHEHLMEEEESVRREALRKVNHSNSVALDEARHKYESAIQNLTAQHTRAISHALEDKQRMEGFLNEKLALADAKLAHYQERTAHLEERLEVATSAAQAAAMNAKTSKAAPAPTTSTAGVPEKVSPQALRESILVLQEQLQERESRIERMQAKIDEAPAKLKERDTEINWLRELLDVRIDEINDVVHALQKPNFDRVAVRDTATRIQTNLEMERQEKERFGRAQQSLSGQALSNLTSFATPRAGQLTSAFNKWRSSMESSALKNQQARPGAPARSYTPSKPQSRPPLPSYSSGGLMTPPASNLRSSPLPDETNALSRPQLNSRPGSKSSARSNAEQARPSSRHASGTSERPHTPLFREQSYDRDADYNEPEMPNFEDDDLDDVADHQPPAFRSLEHELEEPEGETEAVA
ncbi:Rac guanine nucleotide exchange factor JJ [Lecanosticta acicola]|uniref:Rac guanine nucleotide exchange factor JJ n=1 Tax=Lecanosticta acicola TaxID=111012 RepID=A0AAI9E9H3_9PEZI|nr:Rac guanine nucleotide exchange factor JJ [Lecanosticta acicola]